jgi:hypothetical protein
MLYGDAGNPAKLAARIRAAAATQQLSSCSFIYNRAAGDATILELPS